MNVPHKLIGLTGTNGSGKGEAAAFFTQHGFAYFSLSDLIREKLKEQNIEPSRDNLISMGNTMREQLGPDILARQVMKKITHNSVIDSIRNPKEILYLKRIKNFILLAIDAPAAIRYERVKNRGRNESASSLQEFIEKEAQEMSSNSSHQQLKQCMQMADVTITNAGSLDDFFKKLEKYL